MPKISWNTGLVLEGGGMRGVFTSGVLDAFMKHDIQFKYVVAVSAGACNGLSYISRQPRRARYSNIDMLHQYDYIGLRHLVSQGCIFDPDLLYDKFPNELIPFDWKTYSENPATFEMVVTNCATGRAEYLSEKNDNNRLQDICRATSSLPYVSKVWMVDGKPMLDGGIVDSIPVERAMATGHEHNVVIMTRNYGYRHTSKDVKIPPFIYKKYPRLRLALSKRVATYNRQLQLVEDLEREGRVEVIRPQRPMDVGRMERNITRLEKLYEEGFALGEEYALKK
ncbi:MAG: patatin family protein [Prevotella sp.]|nr:patatin family protein [Prevotella sp.]